MPTLTRIIAQVLDVIRRPARTPEALESVALLTGAAAFVIGFPVSWLIFGRAHLAITGAGSIGWYAAVGGAVVFEDSAAGVQAGLAAGMRVIGVAAHSAEHGAIQALGSRAGTDVKVVAFDGTDDGLKAIKAGTMVGTIAQQPGELGKLAVDQAVKALKGEKVDATVPVKVVSVSSKNVDEYLK